MQGALKTYLQMEECKLLITELYRRIDIDRKQTPILTEINSPTLALKHLAEIEGMETMVSALEGLREMSFQESPLEKALKE